MKYIELKTCNNHNNNNKKYSFDLDEHNDELFLGRTNLELNSDKISRKTCKLKHDLTIDGYRIYLIGLLDPTDPAVLIKYKNKMTFTDTLTNGMKLDLRTVAGIKFMNAGNNSAEFSIETEKLVNDDVESETDDSKTKESHENIKSADFREGCPYLDKCYRKNPAHRKEFSHPGDSDWLQGECEYGTNCYRKNKAHRSRFTHTKRQARNQAKRVKYNHSDDEEDSDNFDDLTDEDEDEDYVDSSE